MFSPCLGGGELCKRDGPLPGGGRRRPGDPAFGARRKNQRAHVHPPAFKRDRVLRVTDGIRRDYREVMLAVLELDAAPGIKRK